MKQTKYQKAAKAYHQEALKTLEGFISINSVYDEKTLSGETPFGLGVRKALDYIASEGTKLGFAADTCDHYATELSFGEGPLIDIYAHADVVPVSKSWATDPFKPTIIDNVMYGRGTTDDKGPGVAALYALKMVKDMGLIKGVKVRLIYGGNEERGSLCLEHYFHVIKKGYPLYGFTPDGDFPLIFAEKGIYTYEASYAFSDSRLASFDFGEATNIVLAEASVTLKEIPDLADEVEKYQKAYPEIKVSLKDDVVTFKGKAAHGSLPWQGVNGGLHMLNFVGTVLHSPMLKKVFADYEHGDGKPFKGDYASKYFDSSSYCVGKMSYDGHHLTLDVNMRLPETVKAEDGVINAQQQTGASIRLLGGSPALIMDPNSEFIKTLMKSYQDETGDKKSQPKAIGGGTYARDSKNSVAFGAEFPGSNNHMHDDNELITLDDFYKSIPIYADAIASLIALANKR